MKQTNNSSKSKTQQSERKEEEATNLHRQDRSKLTDFAKIRKHDIDRTPNPKTNGTNGSEKNRASNKTPGYNSPANEQKTTKRPHRNAEPKQPSQKEL